MLTIRKFLLFLTIRASVAQFQYHHQQVINEVLGEDGSDMNVKALDNAITATGEDGFAFAANFCPIGATQCPQTLLVQLGANTAPFPSPFLLRWAVRYFDNIDSKLIVQDMKQLSQSDPNGPGFLLCGRYERLNDPDNSGAYMMIVDIDGMFRRIEIYRSIFTLKSFVEDQEGYFAVGKAVIPDPFAGTTERAVMLSTDKDFNPLCQNHIYGTYGAAFGLDHNSNTFDEVIRYSNDEYAMVGSTKYSFDDGCSDTTQSDVLFVRATKDCSVVCKRQIGSDLSSNGVEAISEWGRALTKIGNLVVITGDRRIVKTSNCNVASHNILFFVVTNTCNYDKGAEIDVDGDIDNGLSIIYDGRTGSVYVGGESRNEILNENSTSPDEKDLFILEFQSGSGFKKFELFGGDKNENADVDLVLSSDGVVMLGNSRSFISNSTVSNAHLIERFRNIDDDCYNIRMRPDISQIALPEKEAREILYNPSSYAYDVISENVDLNQEAICEKIY